MWLRWDRGYASITVSLLQWCNETYNIFLKIKNKNCCRLFYMSMQIHFWNLGFKNVAKIDLIMFIIILQDSPIFCAGQIGKLNEDVMGITTPASLKTLTMAVPLGIWYCFRFTNFVGWGGPSGFYLAFHIVKQALLPRSGNHRGGPARCWDVYSNYPFQNWGVAPGWICTPTGHSVSGIRSKTSLITWLP